MRPRLGEKLVDVRFAIGDGEDGAFLRHTLMDGPQGLDPAIAFFVFEGALTACFASRSVGFALPAALIQKAQRYPLGGAGEGGMNPQAARLADRRGVEADLGGILDREHELLLVPDPGDAGVDAGRQQGFAEADLLRVALGVHAVQLRAQEPIGCFGLPGQGEDCWDRTSRAFRHFREHLHHTPSEALVVKIESGEFPAKPIMHA